MITHMGFKKYLGFIVLFPQWCLPMIYFMNLWRESWKYVAKAKCKDEDAEYTSELEGEEHGENANMVKTNIEIKVEEEFPAGINIVKEVEGDNDGMPKEENPSACGKDRYEGTGNKKIEHAKTEIAVYEDI